jgi:hypothetical protein
VPAVPAVTGGTSGTRVPGAFPGEGVSPKLLVALVALVALVGTDRYLFEEGKAPGLGIESALRAASFF